ncbi:alpha/beta-hydrolase [Epithele typhae]|uniref:alpha/beta-hydrolase n=1 Tax=Epithele typhae TaxID=378194 RepID=UPI0020087925|nr:alpha/beta-hydrolase [Epithele typhae]KAH9924679.1 alpha/beta-hydrolase [Epithele typhae]
MHFVSTLLLGALVTLRVAAAPAATVVSPREANVVSTTQMSSYAPFTQFALAAYCDGTATWSCGDACDSVSSFRPSLAGGDGNAVQKYYVGYWPDQNAVVIAYEGTDPPSCALSDLTDVDLFLAPLDATLFPGIPSSAEVHEGFANEHAIEASAILAETKSLLSSKGATTVITVGHSLGGALAELSALFMTLNLPSSVHVKSVTFGTPRVSDFVRINHDHDPIPIVPGRSLGFRHVHGEIHILDSNGKAYACSPDDDATDSQCTISTVPNIFDSNILDHLGPYEGTYLGTIFC